MTKPTTHANPPPDFRPSAEAMQEMAMLVYGGGSKQPTSSNGELPGITEMLFSTLGGFKDESKFSQDLSCPELS